MDVTSAPMGGIERGVRAEEPTLRGNTLSLFDTTAIAVASVAPAYSIAATIFLLVAAVGFGTPAIILISFIPVLFIAFAYYFMNRRDPDCGASYAWLARTMNPYIGWFNGWVQTAASVLFCIAAPALAGANTLALLESFGWISGKTASSTLLTALIGLAWLILVSAMVIYGIRLTANFQWVMVLIEYLVVLAFSITGLIRALAFHPAGSRAFSLTWFSPGSVGGYTGLAAGAALGVFLFWGWDTAANLNEESEASESTPGIAGILSMFILLVIFLINAASMQTLLPAHTITQQGGNALFFFAQRLAPAPFNYLMLLAILSSTVATTQTTLLPASRVTYSMARDGVLPKLFGTISPRFRTPAQGTFVLALVAAIGLMVTTLSPTVSGTFGGLIGDIGVLVAFYYGITGFACAWAYRHILFKSPTNLILAGILPFVGGLFLFWVAYQVIIQSGIGYSIPIIVTFGLGIPLVILARLLAKTDYFHRPTVSYQAE
ncbi:MAG TPA: APC family permease [Candidatus Dormibacteraeota bacterium]|nr:APC family permease [Candidatus Dormibacteraeota bacterium]